jgi:hypothetical protein
MNAAALAKLDRMLAELESAVRDDLAKHTDAQLDELVDTHLQLPELVLLGALQVKGGHEKLCAMAALSIYRERLRRAEVQLMEEKV